MPGAPPPGDWWRSSAGGPGGRCLVPGHDGALVGISRMARGLGPEQPVWAFPLIGAGRRGLSTWRGAASHGLGALDGADPYRLAGVCFGRAGRVRNGAPAGGDRRARGAGRADRQLNPAWRGDQWALAVAAARARQWRVKAAYHAAVLRRMTASRRALLGEPARGLCPNYRREVVGPARAGASASDVPGARPAASWAHGRCCDYVPGRYGGRRAPVVNVQGPAARRPRPRLARWGARPPEEGRCPFVPTARSRGGTPRASPTCCRRGWDERVSREGWGEARGRRLAIVVSRSAGRAPEARGAPDLVRRWAGGMPAPRMLKTDLFEDAFGEDQLVERWRHAPRC